MRDEYDFKDGRPNPYADALATAALAQLTIEYDREADGRRIAA